MTLFHDITLPIRDGMPTYPDDPGVEIEPHSRIEDGDDANVSRIRFGSHTGTHLDAPLHFLADGRPVDRIPLDRLIGPARVVRIPDRISAIGPDHLRDAGADGARRLLLRTRNAGLLGDGRFHQDHAYLTGDAAELMVDEGVELVGFDYFSVEAFDADEPRVHQVLLRAGVVIAEALDLRAIDPGDYDLICLPIRLEGLDGAPVRAVLGERS